MKRLLEIAPSMSVMLSFTPRLSLVAFSAWTLALATIGSAASAVAQIPNRPAPFKYCDLSLAVSNAQVVQSQRQERMAALSLGTIEQFRKILDGRNWKDGVPLGEQMTPEEANLFGNLQERMKSNTLASLIESKRERDIRVIARMARLADQVARYGYDVPKDDKSEDYILLGMILGLRDLMPIGSQELLNLVRRNEECAIEDALIVEALSAVTEAERTDGLAEASAAATDLAKKYATPLDPQKMSPPDRQSYVQAVRPILQKAQSKLTLAQDLVRLSRLEVTSNLMLEGWRQDQYEVPGDVQNLGTTWNAWVQSGRVTGHQNDAQRVINLINEKIPAAVVKQWDALTPPSK